MRFRVMAVAIATMLSGTASMADAQTSTRYFARVTLAPRQSTTAPASSGTWGPGTDTVQVWHVPYDYCWDDEIQPVCRVNGAVVADTNCSAPKPAPTYGFGGCI